MTTRGQNNSYLRVGQERCSLSFCPRRLLSFPSQIFGQERRTLNALASIRMFFWEANKYWLFFFWGKMKANVSECVLWSADNSSFISVILPGLSFSFTIAFIFSLQPQRRVWWSCAGIAGYFLVGSCPWRVWSTVVCWKVLASKNKGLY